MGPGFRLGAGSRPPVIPLIHKLARPPAAPYASPEMDHTAFFARPRTWLGTAILVCPAIFGCSGSDRLKKQVAGLETQITAMRADQDRLEERLAAVELSSAVPRTPANSPSAERLERPRLKVIHLAPDDDAEASAQPVDGPTPSAPTPATRRPIIRGTGDRVIKVGDGDAADESTRRDEPSVKPVAQLGKDSRGN